MKPKTMRWIVPALILSISLLLVLRAWSLRAGMHNYKIGDIDRALPLLKIARVLNPFTKDVPIAIAEIYIRKDRFEDAEELLRGHLNGSEGSAIGHNLLGVALQAQKKYDEALREYKKAIELDNYYAMAYLNYGYLLVKDENYAEGLSYLHRAVELDPKLKPNLEEIMIKFIKPPSTGPLNSVGGGPSCVNTP